MIGNKRNFPAALVVPNFEQPREAGRSERGIACARREELVREARGGGLLRRRRCSELTGDLAQFEKIKKVALLPREFSHGGGRADADPQGEAPRRGAEDTRT